MKKQTFISLLVSTLLIGSSALAIGANPALCDLTLINLGEKRVETLLKASTGDYKVRIFSGQVERKTKTVILLGETHVKDGNAAKVGNEIVSQYDFKGVESADPSKTWGGAFLSKAADFAFLFTKITSLGRRSHQTTIDSTERKTLLQQCALNLAHELQDGRIKREDFKNISFTIGEETITAEQVIEELGLNSGTYTHSTTVKLEEGHQPDIFENIQSLLLPAMMLSWGGAIGNAVAEHYFPGNPVSKVLSPVTLTFFVVTAGPLYGAKIFGKWYEDKTWYKYVFRVGTGLLDGRNRTMVGNIQKALTEKDSDDAMLVIVGKGHVPGMSKILQEKLGFQEVPLAGTKPNSQQTRVQIAN